MPNRYKDWLSQANRDLKHAESSLEMRDYEWVCFAAQQAAEKSVKALYYYLGKDAKGHSILKLLRNLLLELSEEILQKAAYLDKFYIPSRYPDGFIEGAPFDFFTKKEAEESIKYAKEIILFVEGEIKK